MFIAKVMAVPATIVPLHSRRCTLDLKKKKEVATALSSVVSAVEHATFFK
jgi:hypothetical protein